MTYAGAPLDALLRRSHYGVGPRFSAFAPISQLLAGGRITSGRSPAAAECVLCVSTPAGAAPAKARNCRAPATEASDLFSGPISDPLRAQDAS